MTARMLAGLSVIGSRRASVRLPTGTPVARYSSTTSRRIVAARVSSVGSGLSSMMLGIHRDMAGRSRPL